MALPQDRIKVISIPEVVNEEQVSKPYAIVPEMLGKNGYSAELPYLTSNVTLVTTDQIKDIFQHYISIKADSNSTVISCKIMTQGNIAMTAAQFAQFVYDELPDATGLIAATGTVKISSLDHKYVGAIGKGSTNASLTVYPLVSTGGYDNAVTLAVNNITTFVDIVDRIGAHGGGSSSAAITGQDVINALGYVPTHVEANPVSTTTELTSITIGNVNYSISSSNTSLTPLVTGTPAATVTIDPYKVYNFGTLTQAMVVSFNSALVPSGYCAEYTLRFTAGAGADITLPSNVKINNGSLPTFTVGRVYEINIVDNLAVVGEFY